MCMNFNSLYALICEDKECQYFFWGGGCKILSAMYYVVRRIVYNDIFIWCVLVLFNFFSLPGNRKNLKVANFYPSLDFCSQTMQKQLKRVLETRIAHSYIQDVQGIYRTTLVPKRINQKMKLKLACKLCYPKNG